MQSIELLVIAVAARAAIAADWSDYEGNIKFQIYKDINSPFYSYLGDNLEAQGCPSDKNCELTDT